MTERRLPLLAATLSIAVLACSTVTGLFSSSANEFSGVDSNATSGPSAPTSACRREGFPCSYAEADPQAVTQGQRLLDEASQVISQGGTIPEAAEFLQAEEEVVDLLYDRLALRFRVADAPPMWLIHPIVLQSQSTAAAQRGILASPRPQQDGPVGEQEAGEEPEHRALVLAPFFWEFGTEEGRIAFQLIGKHRNYECANCRDLVVTTKGDLDSNGDGQIDDIGSQGVNLVDFQRWDEYDLIHVSTHGTQLCEGETDFSAENFTPSPYYDCYTALFTGTSVSDGSLESLESQPGFDIEGVGWARNPDNPVCHRLQPGSRKFEAEGCQLVGRHWQYVTADFFLFGYPNGLDDKHIFLSACESMKGRDLARALSGENTTVLGWTEAIGVDVASSVVSRFYRHYIADGLRAQPAYLETKEALGSASSLSMMRPKGGGSYPNAVPEIILDGSPNPRGREAITLMHPFFERPVDEDTSLPIEGVAGDGKDDELLFMVQLDGIYKDENPADFTIHLNINGDEMPETYVVETKISEYTYWTEVLKLPLPFDATEREHFEVDAWVELPNGGESRHVVEQVTPAGCGWTAVLSGSRSGELKGDIAIDLVDFADVDASVWQALGFPEGPPPQIDPGSSEDLSETLMLTGEPTFPAMIVSEAGASSIIFQPGFDAAIDAEGQTKIMFEERTEDHYSGNLQSEMLDTVNRDTLIINGEFHWDAGSLCDLEVIAAAAQKDPAASDGQ